ETTVQGDGNDRYMEARHQSANGHIEWKAKKSHCLDLAKEIDFLKNVYIPYHKNLTIVYGLAKNNPADWGAGRLKDPMAAWNAIQEFVDSKMQKGNFQSQINAAPYP